MDLDIDAGRHAELRLERKRLDLAEGKQMFSSCDSGVRGILKDSVEEIMLSHAGKVSICCFFKETFINLL